MIVCTYMYVLLFLYINSVSAADLTIEFEPDLGTGIFREKSVQNVTATINGTVSSPVSLKLFTEPPGIFEIVDPSSVGFLQNGVSDSTQIRFEIRAIFIGRADLKARLLSPEGHTLESYPKKGHRIAVSRSPTGQVLSIVFTAVISCMVVVNTFMMGCQLNTDVIKDVLKRPIGPIIGFCCQYIIMPLLSFGFAMLLLKDYPSLQLGFFAVGCSPGGGNSNFWTILLEGNLDLSITMTFCSTVAAIFMMPFWLYTLGRLLYVGNVHIPFDRILLSLIMLIIPASVGIFVRFKRPKSAETFKKPLKYFTLFIVVFILTFGIYANLYIFKSLKWYTLVCGMLLPWCGYILAYAVATILRQGHKNALTIAIETGIQNGGIAIMLCKFSFDEPDSDLALVMPVSVMLFTTTPLWLSLLVRTIRRRCFDKKDDPPKDENDNVKKDTVPPSTVNSTAELSNAAYYNESIDTTEEKV